MIKKFAVFGLFAIVALGGHSVHAQVISSAARVGIVAGAGPYPTTSAPYHSTISVQANSAVYLGWTSYDSANSIIYGTDKPCVGSASPANSAFSGSYVATGNVWVSPTVSTVYTITCGGVSDTVVVNVIGKTPATAPASSGTAAPSGSGTVTIVAGPGPYPTGKSPFGSTVNAVANSSVYLSWTSYDATGAITYGTNKPCTGSSNPASTAFAGPYVATGNMFVSPSVSTVYTITCGNASDHVTVNISGSTAPSVPSVPSTPSTPSAPIAPADASCTMLTNDIQYGDGTFVSSAGMKADILSLQHFLIAKGYLSSDSATGYFGSATLKAVITFQNAYGITPAQGFVGAITRAKIMSVSCGGNTDPVNHITPYVPPTIIPVATDTPATPPTPIVDSGVIPVKCGNGIGQTPCEVILAPSTTSCLQLSSVIAEGSTGIDVTNLQDFLRTQGYFSGASTGYFGSVTAASVSAFQRANGLDPVGSVGPQTRARIAAISCNGATSVAPAQGSSSEVAPALVFKANASTGSITVLPGDAVLLSWTATPANSIQMQCTASGGSGNDGWSGIKPYTGLDVYYPTGNTSYTLTCTSPSGSASQTVAVSIGSVRSSSNPNVNPNVTIAQTYTTPYFQIYAADGVTPTKSLTIPYGQTLSLPWGFYGVNTWTCTANPGNVSGSGTGVLLLTSTNSTYPTSAGTTYTLSCRNTSTGQTSTDAVTVNTSMGPTAYLTAPAQQGVSYTNASVGISGGYTLDLSKLNPVNGFWLQWSVSQGPTLPNSTSCTFAGFPANSYWNARTAQAASATGNIFIHPTGSGTYTVTCTDSSTGKSSTASVTTNVTNTSGASSGQPATGSGPAPTVSLSVRGSMGSTMSGKQLHLQHGESLVFSWSSTNGACVTGVGGACGCTLAPTPFSEPFQMTDTASQPGTPLNPGGAYYPSPSGTTYTLSCPNSSGVRGTDSVTVYGSSNQDSTFGIVANPTTYNGVGPSYLSWWLPTGNQCSGTNSAGSNRFTWSGVGSQWAASQLESPIFTTTYNLTCTVYGISSTKSATITVPGSQATAASLDLKAGSGQASNTNFPSTFATFSDAPASNPLLISAPNWFYLTWNTLTGLSSCHFAPPYAGIPVPTYQNYVEYGPGDQNYPTSAGSTYTLSCINSSGSQVSDSVTVKNSP